MNARNVKSVLIAGAGPVGLTAALGLARLGVRVEVFEKRPTPNLASKGSTFHPPTLEILDELGVADKALRNGQRASVIDYYDRGRRVARLEMNLIADLTRFPFRIQYEQADVTADMFAALRRYSNATVRLDAAVAAAETTAGGVRLSLEDGTKINGSLLVAADGAKSTLRTHLGIAFEGEDYASRVLRIFTHAELGSFIPDIAPVSYLYDGKRSVSALKMARGWRILFRIPAGQSDEAALEDTHIRSLLQETFRSDGRSMPIVWKDVYATSRRVAERYHDGRIVLAGDAAHVTNTRGGMNMNCGIHDAYALVEAAARILNGATDERELEGYAWNRRRVAKEHLIPLSDRAVSTGAARLAEMRAVAADPVAARAYLAASSLLDIAPPRNARALA